jgi:hypothetical protein
MSTKTTAAAAAPAAAPKAKKAEKPSKAAPKAEKTAAASTDKKKKKTSKRRGVTVKDVEAMKLIVAFAAYLKATGKVTIPKWANIVKTGIHKELAPYNPDWFYVRMGK